MAHDDDVFTAQPHSAKLRTETKLADEPRQLVVPDHDLRRRAVRAIAAADKGKDVGLEEHLDNPDPACVSIEFLPEFLNKGVTAVDPKAMIGASSEAAIILIEGEVEKLRQARVLGWDVGVEGLFTVVFRERIGIRV